MQTILLLLLPLCVILLGMGCKDDNEYSDQIEGYIVGSFVADEILTPDYNGDNCGPVFFPDSLKYAYKISFKYQIARAQNEVQFVTGPCRAMLASFPWENYYQVMVNETSKN